MLFGVSLALCISCNNRFSVFLIWFSIFYFSLKMPAIFLHNFAGNVIP
jgi:hypothetical protein